jgi:hypothetical protein
MTEDRVDRVMVEWPLDGPYDPDRTVDAARAIAELVRYLNHATPPWKSDACLKFPSQLGSTIGALAGALHSLPQLLDQLGRHAGRFGNMPNLYDDQGRDPRDTITDLRAALLTARAYVGDAAQALVRANNAAQRLGLRT